jgi:DmsE family decaheme c-type cytochrome
MRILFTILTTCAGLMLGLPAAWAQNAPFAPIGNEACQTCHVAYEGHKINRYHSDCQACHTPQDKHLAEGGRGTVSLPAADNCLSCHQSKDHKHMNWAFSAHKKAKLDCRDCHGVHSPKIKELNVGMWKSDRNSQLCMSCHKDVAARMTMPSHHPVKEGGLSCVSCHDPHSGKQTHLAGKNTQCTQCHQNQRGPKVFAHAPVVEDCTTCHNPHGSPNRRLLQLAQPMLCLQCHSVTANNHGGTPRGSQLRGCTNCHSAVHGSHSDPLLKY